MIDLSIIIVSYNTSEFLKKCLRSIFESGFDHDRFEVIVVDNASSDNTGFVMKKDFPKVDFIQNKKNVGFSIANNIGLRNATGQYILFLNPDTEVRSQTLQRMVEFMDEYKDIGAATCKVQLSTGELDDAAHRGFPTPWNSFAHFSGLSKLFPRSKLFNGYHLGYVDLDKIHEIDACAGAFMMVRRSAGEQVGWWDEDFFFYGEDLDFCYRLKEKNWKVYYVPDVSILHHKGVSGGIKKHSQHLTTADTETKKRAQKARFEAMRIFYEKHYENKYPKLITWIIMKGINIKSRLIV